MHQEIKKIEHEKNEYAAEFNKNNQDDQGLLEKEIEELQEKLLNATRIESRWIHQRIAELDKKRFRLQDEIYKFEEIINKKLVKIEKIVEQYQSLSIKTAVLGQDASLNEYWFFKDDPTKIFVKVEIAMGT